MTSKHSLRFASATAFGLIAAATAGQAQDTDDASTYLGEIVLVGTGLPTSVLNSPASVSVVGQEQISRVPPSSVARILNEVPGVRVSEDGIKRIKIRGESSQRVAIQIDGQKLADHTTYGTPILIDPGSIERIEIVRGPSSVVSGNRAIGGVINIVTKRGADAPVEVTASAGYFSASEGYRAGLSIAGTVENFDYRLAFSRTDLDDRKTPNRTLVPSGSDSRSLSAHLGYRLDNHYFGFRAQDFDLSADVYTGDPDFRISLPKRDLRKYGLYYEGTDLTPWMSRLRIDAYTQTIDRAFRNDVNLRQGGARVNVISTSDDEQITSGFSARAELDLAPGHRTILGFEYEDDRLKSNKTSNRTIRLPFGPPRVSTDLRFSDATIRTSSIFAQHEVELGQRLTATLGARYYRVKSDLDRSTLNGVAAPGASNSDGRWLGSLGLVYAIDEETTLRANISQGYTYPTLNELFLTTTAGGGTTRGNPDLRPETSTVYEIGARMSRGNAILDATLFYSDAKDYIASINTGRPREAQYRNVNAVRSWGAELSAEFDLGDAWGLRPYVTAAYVNREFRYANGFTTTDSGTPDWTGTIGVRKDWSRGSMSGTWDVFLRGESAAAQRDETGIVVDQTSSYATLNLRGTARLNDALEISFEAGNLLDKSYRSFDQIDGEGRNLSIFLTARF